MDWILPLLLIAAGILAASALIVAKKPDAKQLIEKLAPYQASMGIALLVWCLYNMFVHIGISFMLLILKAWPIGGIALFGGLISGILLGVMFGMPMVAKMSAGGAAKGEQMAKKLAPFQVIIGLVAIVSGALLLLITAGILKPSMG
jgi:hypothetical protein